MEVCLLAAGLKLCYAMCSDASKLLWLQLLQNPGIILYEQYIFLCKKNLREQHEKRCMSHWCLYLPFSSDAEAQIIECLYFIDASFNFYNPAG